MLSQQIVDGLLPRNPVGSHSRFAQEDIKEQSVFVFQHVRKGRLKSLFGTGERRYRQIFLAKPAFELSRAATTDFHSHWQTRREFRQFMIHK